jgi:hypothetical protein
VAPQVDAAAESAAWSKQYDDQQAAQAQKEQASKQEPGMFDQFRNFVGTATLNTLDRAVQTADSMFSDPEFGAGPKAAVRGARDVAAGGITLAANTADSAHSLVASALHNAADTITRGPAEQLKSDAGIQTPQDQREAHFTAPPSSPVWDHAKSSILDFRDAVAVKDPGLADNLIQTGAQLAIPFAGYSRALAGVHGFMNMLTAGAITDATALGPHDPRMADLFSLGRQTEGKLGDLLRALSPDGSALNSYITYLSDRSNESEAEGRLKNVLDGFGVNLVTTPLMMGAASVLKQGRGLVTSLMENGVGSASELATLHSQRGAVGDLSQARPRPALQPGADTAETMFDEQVRKDMDRAAAAGPDAPRPPLVQGGDPAGPLFDAKARADAEAAAAKVGGKIVYHGTPYDFDEFRSAQIGTGEGNQTFGHGLYFAENPKTAGHYQNMMVPPNGALGAAMTEAQKAVKSAGGRAQAYSQLSQQFASEKDPVARQALQQQMSLIRSGNYTRGQGTLVHAEIANEHLDSMMHWDKPISEQPQLQKVISNLDVKIVPEGNNFRVTLNGKPGGLFMDRDAAKAATFHLRGAGRSGEFNGGALYDDLSTVLGSQQAASQFLSRRGVHGIKFLDQGSRDAGEGTHNIVLFNENHAKVVKKEKAGA